MVVRRTADRWHQRPGAFMTGRRRSLRASAIVSVVCVCMRDFVIIGFKRRFRRFFNARFFRLSELVIENPLVRTLSR